MLREQTTTHVISGVGGTGKSFLIDVIKQEIQCIYKDDPSEHAKCAIAAPTGLAAHNINGITLHRLFRLPVEHDGKTAEYFTLPRHTLKQMRMHMSHLKAIICDESSMASNLTLAYIHRRLDDLFGGPNPTTGSNDQWFGGINMLFFGDLLQLPPVNALPIFSPLNNITIAHRLGCIGSANIWRSCVHYDELTINERQKSDDTLNKMLSEVRIGKASQQSLDMLQSRVITKTAKECFQALSAEGRAPLCLFPTCKACQTFNMEMLQALPRDYTTFHCTDEVDESGGNQKWSKAAAAQLKRLNKDCNLTAELESELHIAVGVRVMLQRNLDTSTGLVNRSLGTVVSFTTQCIVVQFDKMAETMPIQRIKGQFMVKKNFYVTRQQFPLILAFAVTIHKCQGLTLNDAIIDLSYRLFSPGMAYVALLRVHTLNGIHLTAFDPAAIMVDKKSLQEVNRLRAHY